MAVQRTAIEAVDISKYFGGIHAVREVTLAIHAGEVLAVVGDNGAGKSTFVKMLSGVMQPSSGELRIDGHRVMLKGAADARAAGIETVYQDLALCPDLTAAENLFLGREPHRLHFGPLSIVDRVALRKGTQEQLSMLSAAVPLHVPVRRMSGGQRQAVAIARAASWGTRLVIFDEPTAALGVVQSQRTLELIREVAHRGPGVVVISHNIDDVFAVSDRIAVMRHGRLTTLLDRSSATKAQVHRLMAGIRDEDD